MRCGLEKSDPGAGAADAGEAGAGGFLEGMLPDADDFPSNTPESEIHAAVAGHIGLAFTVPEGAIGFRAGVTLWATGPKTSIDEDSDFLFRERKVGIAGQRKMPSPASDLVLPQQREQRLLGLLVPLPPDVGHDLGALLFGPDIGHT